MSSDSCRKCGNKLEVNQKCNVCHNAIEFYCHECGNITEKRIHSQCLLINSDQLVKVISKKN